MVSWHTRFAGQDGGAKSGRQAIVDGCEVETCRVKRRGRDGHKLPVGGFLLHNHLRLRPPTVN